MTRTDATPQSVPVELNRTALSGPQCFRINEATFIHLPPFGLKSNMQYCSPLAQPWSYPAFWNDYRQSYFYSSSNVNIDQTNVQPLSNDFTSFPNLVEPASLQSDGRTCHSITNAMSSTSTSPAGSSEQAVQDDNVVRDNNAVHAVRDNNRRAYPVTKGKLMCNTCNGVFTRRNNLRSHQEKSGGCVSYSHICGYPGCLRRYSRPADVERHQRSVRVQPYACCRCH